MEEVDPACGTVMKSPRWDGEERDKGEATSETGSVGGKEGGREGRGQITQPQ